MSVVWRLELDGVKLFIQPSSTKAQCKVCEKKFIFYDWSTKKLLDRVLRHNEYKELIDRIQVDLKKQR